MASEAANWVRFCRLVPIEIGVNMSARTARERVATLYDRGWTADDVAHAVLIGTASARNPAALLQRNLTTLVDGNVPAPIDPDVTPQPPTFDVTTIRPERAIDPSEGVAIVRAALAETRGSRTGTEA